MLSVAMDPKDLRSEATLGECINNGNSNYTQSTSTSTQTGDRNKTYHDIGSNPLGKVGNTAGRPCAVIGPDRAIITAPQSVADEYNKRDHHAHWPLRENIYQQAHFYPQKSSNLINPQRNISPRQTFQENMQRIMVPTTYTKLNGDHNFLLERSDSIPKIVKSNETPKYCDVPFTVNPINGDQKTANSCEMPLPLPNANSAYLPPQNHGWPQNGVIGSHPQPRYGSPDLYQYNDYNSCAVPSNMPYVRPQRVTAEEAMPSYAEHYYRGRNIRFEPYPPAKERYPPPRYDYINRFPSSFQTPPFPSHKFEIHKLPPSYPTNLQGTYIRDPALDGYQRNLKPQINFNVPFPGQGISSKYSAVPGNSLPNKYYPYPDHNLNSSATVQGTYDQRNKLYVDYKGIPPKPYPATQSYYMNEFPRHMVKGQTVPNYSSNVHPLAYYRKDILPAKTSEFLPTFKPNDAVYYNSSPRQHSSNMLGSYDPPINNAPNHQYRRPPEDSGYAPQANGPVYRNMNPAHHPVYNNYDARFDAMMSSHMSSKFSGKTRCAVNEDKKNIDVRQFWQSWSEGDDEGNDSANNSKEIIIQTSSNFSKQCNNLNSQEQLYVLGLVNVPSEELSKYEHIQKVSKLPDNIKGYTNIDLLNQFEEAMQSSKSNTSDMPASKKVNVKQRPDLPGRPVSPFDVESKISQSVIHKDVGCNFEIRPCSPGLVSVQVAAPAQPLSGERTIEKVSNPVNIEPNTLLPAVNKNIVKKPNSDSMAINDDLNVSSCGKANPTEVKLPYSMHDLESNSGVCLASLPRLDNDIELNFPEVNQQFINANKQECVDSVLAKMTEFSGNQSFSESNEACPSKDYSKLIKYRKSKCNESEPYTAPIRTDSVIKNNLSVVEHNSYNNNQSMQPSSPGEENIGKTHPYQNIETNGDALNLTISSSIESVNKIVINKSEMLNEIPPQSNLNQATCIGNDLPSYLLYSNNVSPINSVLSDELGDTSDKYTCIDTAEKNKENYNQVISDDNVQDFEVQNHLINKAKTVEQDDIPETNDSIREYIENSSAMHDEYTDVTNAIVTQLNEEMCSNSKNNIKSDDIFASSKESGFCDERYISPEISKQLECEKKQENEDFQTDEKCCEESTSSDHNFNISEDNIANIAESVLILGDNIQPITTSPNRDVIVEINNQSYDSRDNENSSLISENIEKCLKNSNRFWFQRIFSPIIQNLLYTPYKNFDLNQTMEKNIESNTENEQIKTNSAFSDVLKLKVNNVEDVVTIDSKNAKDQFAQGVNYENIPQFQKASVEILDHNRELNLKPAIYMENKQENIISLEGNKTMYVDTSKECKPCAVSVDGEKYEETLNLDWSGTSQVATDLKNKQENLICLENDEHRFGEVTNVSKPCAVSVNCEKYEEALNQDLSEASQVEIDIENKQENVISSVNDEPRYVDITNVSKPCAVSVDCKKYEEALVQDLSEASKVAIDLENKQENLISLENDEPRFVDITKVCKPCAVSVDCEKYEEALNQDLSEASKEAIDLEKKQENLISLENDEPRFVDITKVRKPCAVSVDCEKYEEALNQDLSEASKIAIDLDNNQKIIISLENDEPRFVDTTKVCKPYGVSVDSEKYKEALNKDVFETSQSCLEKGPTTSHTLRPRILKRSLSESALSSVSDKNAQNVSESNPDKMINPSKRKRQSEDGETHIILDNNLGRVFHINRRNSISALCEDNLSFCIMIDDNCLVTEESVFEGGTICFANIEETNFETNESEELDVETKSPAELENNSLGDKNSYTSCAEDNENENWVDDIACVETVVSVETEHDFNNPLSPTRYSNTIGNKLDEDVIVNNTTNESKEVFYNENSCFTQALYTYQNSSESRGDEVKLVNESNIKIKRNCIEELLSSSDSSLEGFDRSLIETGDSFDIFKEDVSSLIEDMTKEHIRKENYVEDVPSLIECKSPLVPDNMTSIFSSKFINESKPYPTAISEDIGNSLSSSCNYQRSSSSPEVTSTTSDDKKSILLKITKHSGARTLEVNNAELCNNKKIRCKFSEKEDYLNSKIELPVIRPLITKAAQKYIPPLKETIGDLKVKLRLPKDSLIKLRQLKHSKSAPSGIATSKGIEKLDQKLSKPNIVTKQKPKFEDVLKSIDEFQLKTSKDKTKKIKKHVPKVIIKKTENGSHYASRSNKDLFNPDLTGRKWQPWVFLEKNRFIDKMALRGKKSAVYCHRKKTYIFQENFKKYKSVNKYSNEFVMSKPKESFSSCPLKYTIRLKKQT